MEMKRLFTKIKRLLFPYKEWIKLREQSRDEYGERLCYCGHTHKCFCNNPDWYMFKESVSNGTIKLWDKENGWKPVLNKKSPC